MPTNFIIRPLLEIEREQAVHFIEKHEIECTVLMEKLLLNTQDVFVLEKNLNNKFYALFYLRTGSTIFHFIPFLTKKIEQENSENEIRSTINDFLKRQQIFCVYGEHFGTEYIKSLLFENQKKEIVSNEYVLMENNFSAKIYQKEIQAENWKNVIVRKCSLEDLEYLLELERGYRAEEVQIFEREESDRVIRFVLNHTLKTQNVFAAFIKDGTKLKAVAKASTNACGKKYFQIGGVYCSKDFRNQGIANFTMQHLLRFIQAQGKIANLFVKIKNEPAKKLYQNLGFVPIEKYQISYFQK